MSKVFVFLIAIFGGFIVSGCECKESNKEYISTQDQKIKKTFDKEAIRKELAEIDSLEYFEKYVEKVINNGSSGLGFAGGDMDGGFADSTLAKDIAKYVAFLSRRESSDNQIAKKSQMFYTSNCGGCHGDDGKGVGGNFPDLTVVKLKGIEKKENELKTFLEQSK